MAEKVNFKIKTSKEERLLSRDEYIMYIDELRNYCRIRKLEVTTPGAISIVPKIKKVVNKIALLVTKVLSNGNPEKIVEGTENIPEGPVIFACSHQGILDNFVWIPDCPKHALIVHGVETNRLLLLAQYDIGLICVTKNKSKAGKRMAAKLDMISALLKGHSIIIFPETTWNLSPNKLHLPLNYGFIDVAKKSKVPIVPMAIEYSYDFEGKKEKITKVQIKYGKPINVTEKDDVLEKLKEYSDSISTMRWEMAEANGVHQRGKVDNWQYIKFLQCNYKNLKLGKIDRKVENEGIQGSGDEFYKYYYINDHEFDDQGNILETREIRRLRRLIEEKFDV